MNICPGSLYVVSVPIGNLADFTPRAVELLNKADYVACEEVGVSRRLFQSQNIEARLISYRESGREKAGEEIVSLLKEGKTVALVSSAGTPAISDPGRDLVLKCHQNNIKVFPVPGVSALITALSVSGLPSRHFTFEGFLSRDDSSRRESLLNLRTEKRTMIFYEAPHRLLSTLQAMYEIFGERLAFVGRELTKYYEECKYTSLKELVERYQREEARGEFVLVVAGAPEDEDFAQQEAHLTQDGQFLNKFNLSNKDRAEILAYFRNVPKNRAKGLFMSK